MAEELAITGRMAKTRPNYQKTAAALLERCRAFYQDPDNEKAYQEWKARKDGENGKDRWSIKKQRREKNGQTDQTAG